MKRAGKKPIAITHSDPPAFGHLNQAISKYLIEAAENGVHSYRAPIDELKAAICGWEKRYRNVEYSSSDIFPANGVASALFFVQHALLDDYSGDEVCIFEPAHYYWGPTDVLKSFHVTPVQISCHEDSEWQPDPEELRKKISARTKYVLVDNPCNPTGAVYGEKRLKAIIDIAGENDVVVVSDEMYGMITYDGFKARSTADLAGDVPVIVVNGMSKFFMRTGWRVGYVAVHDPAGKISEVKKTITTLAMMYGNPQLRCSPIIYAAAKAYAGTMDGGYNFVKALHPLKEYAMKRLGAMEGVSCVPPGGAFYLFPRIHGIGKVWKTDEEFMTELNKEEALIFCPGSWFGPSGCGHFRGMVVPEISLQKEVWDRLERFLKKHPA